MEARVRELFARPSGLPGWGRYGFDGGKDSGQSGVKGRPSPEFAFSPTPTAVPLRDTLHDVKPQTGAAACVATTSSVRLENILDPVVVNALPRIGYADRDLGRANLRVQ